MYVDGFDYVEETEIEGNIIDFQTPDDMAESEG